ncbi:MAG TPA: glycosyltransferase family 39 protein [Streptosporangiaceae bacterium]
MSDLDRAARPVRPVLASLPDLALGPVLTVAGLLAAALVAFSDRYGYHRDELYFLQCGRHLAWGYPDQPPLVPLIARLMSDLAPGSLVLLRLPSALAAAALVVLTALITREFGGGRTAQFLAAAIIALAGVTLGSSHLLSTTALDLPIWALLCLLLVRILRTGNDRLWVLAGLVAGVGLLDTDLVAFLIFAVVVGLIAVGPRQPLRSPWFYAGGAIALALWAPYLGWQAAHGWPELKVAHSIAAGGSGTSALWWQILPFQFILVAPLFAPIWITGLIRLYRELRWCRALGVAYPVLAVAFMLTGGKPYYLAGMFPVLIGAGAQPAAEWLGRGPVRLRRGLIVAAVLLTLTSVPITLPVLPVGSLHSTPIVALNYDAGETVGWPAFVGEIAAAYRSLPPSQRSSAIVLASNYGEAGAVDRFGPADGLPAAYSGHNAFWYWGPPPATASTAIVVSYSRSQLGFCGNLRLAAVLNNHVNVGDDEQGQPVWICGQLRESWRAIWPSQRYFG